jgi:UDP-2,3-diacylglucosamine hydrolase
MSIPTYQIPDLKGKSIYFASDFHLGAPDHDASRKREDRIVSWLNQIEHDTAALFLMGDLFDFWFEYGSTIPKGNIRLQGKLAFMSDAGIPISIFTGNHDMWMFGYFTEEMNIPIYRDLLQLEVENTRLLIGHGDGLGPGDHTYKFLKKIFRNKFCQWLFERLHPNTGMAIANYWSSQSRISNTTKGEDQYQGDDREYLVQFCQEMEEKTHYDYYVFGHRHLPLDISISDNSRYVNLGEWVNQNTYGKFDGKTFSLETFES